MVPYVKELDVKDIQGLRIGNAQSDDAKTGVTVLYFPDGARTGCDISGGGPASRETPLTLSETSDNPINAIVLSGGSAFGLAAADGVMKCLEENGIGYNTGFCRIPLVCQSCIFDLGYGSFSVRPDADMGYEACRKALEGTDGRMGNIGGGIGASVGKLYGMKRASKAGLGIHSVEVGDLQMTAVVVVNAFGDIINPRDGKKIAGLMNESRTDFSDTVTELSNFMKPRDMFTGNTTIGVIVTNAPFSKAEMNKVASMTRSAYGRCINPVGTMADGDMIYAASVAPVARGITSEKSNIIKKMDINFTGALAAEVMAEAIHKAVAAAQIPDEEFLKNCR